MYLYSAMVRFNITFECYSMCLVIIKKTSLGLWDLKLVAFARKIGLMSNGQNEKWCLWVCESINFPKTLNYLLNQCFEQQNARILTEKTPRKLKFIVHYGF